MGRLRRQGSYCTRWRRDDLFLRGTASSFSKIGKPSSTQRSRRPVLCCRLRLRPQSQRGASPFELVARHELPSTFCEPERRLIPMPATQNSLACGGVREHAAVREGSGRLRGSTAPHVPNVDFRAFAKHVQNVFCSLRCFLDKTTCFLRPPHLADDDVLRTSPSSLLKNTIDLCHALLPITMAQTHNA